MALSEADYVLESLIKVSKVSDLLKLYPDSLKKELGNTPARRDLVLHHILTAIALSTGVYDVFYRDSFADQIVFREFGEIPKRHYPGHLQTAITTFVREAGLVAEAGTMSYTVNSDYRDQIRRICGFGVPIYDTIGDFLSISGFGKPNDDALNDFRLTSKRLIFEEIVQFLADTSPASSRTDLTHDSDLPVLIFAHLALGERVAVELG